MKNLSELFEGGTTQTQKKKKITFYIACVTVVIIATMLLFLAIFGIASLLSKEKEADEKATNTDIGKTVTTTINSSELNSGSLLILDKNNRFNGTLNVVNMQNRANRPKTEIGGNIYTVYGNEHKANFMATDAAVTALDKMLSAFYKSSKDDNIIIASAYDKSNADTQDAIYSSGEAFELTYFYDPNNNTSDQRTIYGIQKYSWIYTNAYKYGFVTVGDDNSNVFRYVGVVHSNAMKQSNLDFDGYMSRLKSATPSEPLSVNVSGNYYAVYYLAKDAEHLVPANYEYTVSGNNIDGYIITVSLSKKATN